MQLYINTYGAYLHVKDQMFEVRLKNEEAGDQIRLFSANKVETIIMAEKCALSSDAVKLALTYNIDIIFTEYDGRPLGRIWHSKLGSTTKIRKHQLVASLNQVGVKAIKNWIHAKNNNQIELLRQLKKHREKHHQTIDEAIRKMEALNISVSALEADKISEIAETIRGLEGTSGRLFFEVLATIIPKEYSFSGRSARPAKDQFNAFLNYAYGILYSKVEKSLMIAGLDPYLGFLHRDDYNQLSFVFDFIEPYRIYAVEVVFKLFSGKKVSNKHTDIITNGFTLNKEGKELLVNAFNAYMDTDTIRYKGKNQTRNNCIRLDAHEFANSLIKNQEPDDEISSIEL